MCHIMHVGDFLKSDEIEGILGNSDFVYLLNQSANDQEILAEKFKLSDQQLKYVTNAEQGSGLIIFDGVIVPFIDRYPKDTKTFAIMNRGLVVGTFEEPNEGFYSDWINN